MQTKLEEVSQGYMTGHWEIMGLNITGAFRYFLGRIPRRNLDKNRRISDEGHREANKPYSGTAVIDDFGPRRWKLGVDYLYFS